MELNRFLHIMRCREDAGEIEFYLGEPRKENYHTMGLIDDNVYWVGYCDIPGGCEFETPEELVSAKIFGGKSLQERWNELRFISWSGISVEGHSFTDYKIVDNETIRQWLPKRDRNAHKGDFGRVLLLCGAVGYSGAPALAAMAAARTGAGLIFVGVPEEIYPIVAGKLLEPMVFPLPSESGMLSEAAIPEILRRLGHCDACLIGCGLGQSKGTFAVVKAVLENAKCPVVIDADGINVLSGHIDVLRGAACPMVLTPHEGEALRLDAESKRFTRRERLMRLQKLTGATVLLKGHRTLIDNGEECYINLCGNPGMATGGSGDVLAGILVSLLGQGLEPIKAAAAAAWLHGTAGDLAAKSLGEYGMLPSDIIELLPRLLF